MKRRTSIILIVILILIATAGSVTLIRMLASVENGSEVGQAYHDENNSKDRSIDPTAMLASEMQDEQLKAVELILMDIGKQKDLLPLLLKALVESKFPKVRSTIAAGIGIRNWPGLPGSVLENSFHEVRFH